MIDGKSNTRGYGGDYNSITGNKDQYGIEISLFSRLNYNDLLNNGLVNRLISGLLSNKKVTC